MAFIDALKAHGVPDEVLGKVCHDALQAINATPVSERERRNAEAAANAARRTHTS
jgi:hypothetical protein